MLKNNKAFSLIELSIVLIIIGLLVAGITGGATLINNAKRRTTINELRNWKQAVYTFRIAKDRLPGDFNDSGIFGFNSGHTYTNVFPAPYNSGHNIPNEISAPFVDLFLENIIDFEPINTFRGNWDFNYSAKRGATPISKAYNDIHAYFQHFPIGNSSSDPGNFYRDNVKNPNFITMANYYMKNAKESKVGKGFYNPRTAQSLDLKLDDGIYNTGNFISVCMTPKAKWNIGYEDTYKGNGECIQISYSVE